MSHYRDTVASYRHIGPTLRHDPVTGRGLGSTMSVHYWAGYRGIEGTLFPGVRNSQAAAAYRAGVLNRREEGI